MQNINIVKKTFIMTFFLWQYIKYFLNKGKSDNVGDIINISLKKCFVNKYEDHNYL